MTYIGVNPKKNLNRFLEVKPESSYPESAKEQIKLLSFSHNKSAQPFGSYIYRVQKYPGDLDLVEEFTRCCSLKDVTSQFAKVLQRVVKKISKSRLHYLSEIKAGLDLRYDVYIGELERGIYMPSIQLRQISENMTKKGLLSKEENNIIQYILSNKQARGGDEYDTIYHIFREHRIIRWNENEILKGEKILTKGKKISLQKALSQTEGAEKYYGRNEENHVKIDMIAEVDGRLVEITNFFQLAYEKDGEMHLVNIDLEKNHDIATQLPIEIEKLYFSNMYYSPFKMIKRMYSLGRNTRDDRLLEKILPFISSNTSLLYQIKSEIDTIILVMEKMKSYPKKTIEKQLDNAKLRISTVLELSQEDLETINAYIDGVNNPSSGKFEKIELLTQLKKYIIAHINYQTIKYLEKVGMNPPPYKYLPPKHKYDVNHARGIAEIPENPYKKYQLIVENMTKGGTLVYYPTQNHHYANFFQDPRSSEYLSNRILSNPGLRDIPATQYLDTHDERLKQHVDTIVDNKYLPEIDEGQARVLWGSGDNSEKSNRVIGFWASFVKRYRKENGSEPPIDFCTFRNMFINNKTYNYKRMLERIMSLTKENYQPLPVNIPSVNIPVSEDPRVHAPLNIPPPPPPPILNPEQREAQRRRAEEARARTEQRKNIPEKSLQERTMDELLQYHQKKAAVYEGTGYGCKYAHNYTMPLYINQNLPLPTFYESNMDEAPLTASSFATNYINRGYGPSLKPVHIHNAPTVINGKIVDSESGGCDTCGLTNFRKTGGIAKTLFKKTANFYRRNYCDGKARPLESGEFHYGCHNYTGPGTRIHEYSNYPPYNNIDNCSRQHDLDYSNAKNDPYLIRKADEDVLKCYDKYPNENGYKVAKLGINSKMKLEDVLPFVSKSIAPSYFGKKK